MVKKIDTFYSSRYAANTKYNSMRKLPFVAAQADKEGLVSLIEPKDVHSVRNRLESLHNPAYVEAFLSGKGELAESNQLKWSPEVRDGVLESVAGTLEAAKLVMESSSRAAQLGVSASISAGFHHAYYEHGSGYCTFNALALVAQELPDKKIFVLDCDEHFGDGTSDFAARLSNLYNFSIYGTDMGGKFTTRVWKKMVRSGDEGEGGGWREYEAALQEGFTTILEVQPDLVLYQAGMDCIAGDGMATVGLSSAQAHERDRQVFSFCNDMNIPITFVLAGGYGDNAVDNHVGTFRTAVEVYSAANQ